jgi:hypothetical protein
MIRSGKRPRMQIETFPEEPDKEIVLMFLERVGCKEIEHCTKSVQEAPELEKASGSYITGPYSEGNWASKWIMFCLKGSKNVFFLRTEDCGISKVSSAAKGCLFYSVWSQVRKTWKDFNTYDEMVEEINLELKMSK